MRNLFQDPVRLAALQSDFVARQARLWADLLGGRAPGEDADRRFAARVRTGPSERIFVTRRSAPFFAATSKCHVMSLMLSDGRDSTDTDFVT